MVRQLLPGLDRLWQRRREALDVVRVRRHRKCRLRRFFIELRGLPERVPAHLRRLLAGRRDALELAGGLARPPAFEIGQRKVPGHVGLACARRIGAAEGLEHGDRARPVLQPDEQRARIEFRGLANRGSRSELADSQVIEDRARGVTGRLLRLALLVDRRREPLGDRGTSRGPAARAATAPAGRRPPRPRSGPCRIAHCP